MMLVSRDGPISCPCRTSDSRIWLTDPSSSTRSLACLSRRSAISTTRSSGAGSGDTPTTNHGGAIAVDAGA